MKAETIAKALGGRKAAGCWITRCPRHDDREPSLLIRNTDNGGVPVRCHAGCDQGRVIAALRSRGPWSNDDPRRFILSDRATWGPSDPKLANAVAIAAGLTESRARRVLCS